MSPLTESTRLTLAKQSVAPGLLDAYGGAAAAYSLRRLSANYTGPVVRVRRSSDNTEQDFIATQVTDGTLTTFCGAGNGFVRTWYDQSTSGNNGMQSTIANQPQLVASGSLITQSGKPVIRFDGNNDTFTRSSFGVNGFVYLAALGGTGSTNNTFQSLSESLVITDDSNPRRWAIRKSADATVTADTVIAFTSRALLSLRTVQNSMTIWVNSVERASDSATSTFSSADTTLFGGGGLGAFNGDVHELIIYNSDQSINRTGIESNINAHYAIY